MKKFFALMLVIAMLSVAGAAMAADTSLTASVNKLSVTTGSTKTVTLTATAGHGGTLSAITVSGATWATISGSTLTLAPTATGTTTLTASVTETYTIGGDSAGHVTPRTITETAIATIVVTAVEPVAQTQIITRIVETVVEVTQEVTVVSRTAQGSTVVQTFTETVRSVTQAVTVAVLTQVEGFTPQLAQVWEAKATQVETARTTTVTAIANNPTRRAAVFPNLPAAAVVTPRANSSLVSVTSSVKTSMTVTEKLAVATLALGGAGKALSATDAVQATESGTYSFVKTFGKALYGTAIRGNKGQRARTAASFAASAADDTGVAFINSSGDVVTTIPDDSDPENIMPGYVTMLVVMEAGETYEPVVYATETALASAGVSVDSTPTAVTYNEVTEKEEKVAVTVKEDGTVEETVLTVSESDPAVVSAEANMSTAMSTALGTTVTIKSVNANIGSGVAAATITAEDNFASEASMHVAARPAISYTNLSDGVYYMPVKFFGLPSGKKVVSGAAFEFYPDGMANLTTAYYKVFSVEGKEVTDPSSLLGNTEAGTEAYLAFVIENTGIRTADTDNTLSNPTVAIDIEDSAQPPVSDDVLVYLRSQHYINDSNTILDAGFNGGRPDISSYVATVRLNFDVLENSWEVGLIRVSDSSAVAGISPSAYGTITTNGTREATITLNQSEIPDGTYAVQFSVRPTYNGDTATEDVVGLLSGTIEGNPGYVYGVGSSSGGCSAGSAVLALAVLGMFIASRKK